MFTYIGLLYYIIYCIVYGVLYYIIYCITSCIVLYHVLYYIMYYIISGALDLDFGVLDLHLGYWTYHPMKLLPSDEIFTI